MTLSLTSLEKAPTNFFIFCIKAYVNARGLKYNKYRYNQWRLEEINFIRITTSSQVDSLGNFTDIMLFSIVHLIHREKDYNNIK